MILTEEYRLLRNNY